ncbi:MAG TPA: hypothetical protein VI854_00660, partial [Acidimicrobiia bacterium]|nr:hypothetical protein [Acidimicrobiia bacterium]
MAQGRRDNRLRIIVAIAAVASGLIVGLVVAGLVSGGGEPAPYAPFFAGLKQKISDTIRTEGPVFYPDPRGGTRAFYLDLEGDGIVALHVVRPGGTAECPVEYDHTARRYTDSDGEPVDPATLRPSQASWPSLAVPAAMDSTGAGLPDC